MGVLAKLSALVVVVVVLLTIGFHNSIEVRYHVCFLSNVGYLDVLGSSYKSYWEKCIADASHELLLRDFPEGTGRVSKIHEVDCANGFTFEQFRAETKDFTIPFICRGMLKNNMCTNWDLNYFSSLLREDEWLRVLDLGDFNYTRKAFTSMKYPHKVEPAPVIFERIKEGNPLFLTFDNSFLTAEHPELVQQMELDTLFPGKFFIHNTLFLSNFRQKTLGSAFHAAPSDNFFFQCRGRKHWYYLEPKYLRYVGAYLSSGVIYTTDHTDEAAILSRLPLFEGIIEEGDVMYNPPFWLHAVGTPPGMTISVANRFWDDFVIPRDPNAYYWDAIYKFQFPQFVTRVVYSKIMKTLVGNSYKITSLSLRETSEEPYIPPHGLLPVVD